MSLPSQEPRLWHQLNESKMRFPQGQPGYQDALSTSSSMSKDEALEDENGHLLEEAATSSRYRNHWQSTSCWSRHSNTFLILFVALGSCILSVGMTLLLSNNAHSKSVISSYDSSVTSIAKTTELNAPFQPVPRLRHCGTSVEEARSLGCKFQIWSYSWVPPECYDEELVHDWLAMRDWEYYDDRYGKGKVVNFTTEVLRGEGDRMLYSTWGQHYWHCAFTWRKFLRSALGSGVGITDQDLDYHHANHCQDTIKNKPDYRPWDENDIQLTVGFHRC